MTSSLPVADGPLLLSKAETSSNTVEKKQARLDDAFDALVERLARTENSLQDHPLVLTPAKRNFADLAYYVFSEIPPVEKPADIVLKAMKNLPVGTPVEEIRRASDAFGLDFNFMKAVAKIRSNFNPKQRTGSYMGCSSSAKMSSNNTVQDTLPIRATTLSPALTNSPRRLCSLSSGSAENPLSVIFI